MLRIKKRMNLIKQQTLKNKLVINMKSQKSNQNYKLPKKISFKKVNYLISYQKVQKIQIKTLSALHKWAIKLISRQHRR